MAERRRHPAHATRIPEFITPQMMGHAPRQPEPAPSPATDPDRWAESIEDALGIPPEWRATHHRGGDTS